MRPRKAYSLFGSQLRVYVDGALALQATDGSHATGVSGAVTYRTAAD
jgi:hypothetical protein